MSPWAVAVGGTVLSGDGTTPEHRFAENAWAYTGDGNSTSEPAGGYQQGVVCLAAHGRARFGHRRNHPGVLLQRDR